MAGLSEVLEIPFMPREGQGQSPSVFHGLCTWSKLVKTMKARSRFAPHRDDCRMGRGWQGGAAKDACLQGGGSCFKNHAEMAGFRVQRTTSRRLQSCRPHEETLKERLIWDRLGRSRQRHAALQRLKRLAFFHLLVFTSCVHPAQFCKLCLPDGGPLGANRTLELHMQCSFLPEGPKPPNQGPVLQSRLLPDSFHAILVFFRCLG
jgi:hypothetical protein